MKYQEANFAPEKIWMAFREHQVVGQLYVQSVDGYECLGDGVFGLAMAISQGDQLYRAVKDTKESN